MALILIKFGEDRTIGRTLIDVALAGDDLLLLQAGALWLLDDKVIQELNERQVSVYALKDDLEARGYTDGSFCDITQVDYDGAIKLVEKNERIIG